MGVHGLWKLLEPSGEPVALETLENKVLAIDVSMWLHQVLKGYHDASGNALPNAHLLGLFHRICKLMFFGIKPVFVFDGGVPQLKQQTMINRKRQKKTAGKRAEDERMRLLRNLMEQDILQRVRGNTSGSTLLKMPTRKNDTPSPFELPQDEPEVLQRLNAEETDSSDDDIEEIINWDNFDPNSREFKMLPAMKRLEILNNLKDSRKQGSWRRMHDMPQDSDDFSVFQMRRLLVRRSAQVEMEEAEKELSKTHTLTMQEIKEIMAEKGSLATKLSEMDVDYGSRIASDAVTRVIMIRNTDINVPKLAIEEEKIFPEEPAVKVKQEAEETEGVPSITETGEIIISDDEGERALIETMFVSNLEKQANKSDLTQEEILALIQSGEKQHPVKAATPATMEDFNRPSTSRAAPVFIDYDREEERNKTVDFAKEHVGQTKVDEDKATEVSPAHEVDLDSEEEELVEVQSSTISIAKSAEQRLELKEISENVTEVQAPTLDAKEVADKPVEKKPEESLEISILPEETPGEEDDLFSGVFSDAEKEESKSATPVSEVAIMSSSEDTGDETVEEVERVTPVEVQETEKSDKEDEEPSSVGEELPAATAPKTDFRSMSFTDEEMKAIEEKLAREQASIVAEIGRQERIATNLSDQICNEAQELIALFGLPFLVAPMEAEAQCAMLDLLSLTNGTVTDDSDIWLFGGRTVYRNFFNQAKNVERYTSDSIFNSFKLSRDRLILLAMLVGSDYTVGLQGIGPVTALEIIAEFCNQRQNEIGDPEELVLPLKRFREWWQSKEITNMRRKKLKNTLKEISFHEGFPSEAVVDAYVHPQVNDAKDKFKWEKPNIDGLIDFTFSKFGWTKHHAESVLEPVIKRLGETKVQGRIDSYFMVESRPKDLDIHLSTRVRKAVTQLGAPSQSDEDEPQPSTSESQPSTSTQQPAPKKSREVTRPKKGKSVPNSSKLGEFKQQLTKKPKPLKAADLELKPKKSAVVPTKEVIPQREKNKESALQSRLKAIEVFRKRKIDPVIKPQRPKRVVAQDGYLSESSESD